MLEIYDHLQALNIKERSVTVEPTDDLEEVSFDDNILGQIAHIGTQADPLVHKKLALFLKTNRNVFTWSHKDMPEISPNTMVHKLDICSSIYPVR